MRRLKIFSLLVVMKIFLAPVRCFHQQVLWKCYGNRFKSLVIWPLIARVGAIMAICLVISFPGYGKDHSNFYSSGSKGIQQEYDMVVAKDGSGDFKYIQDAIDACRAFTPKRLRIFIKNGVYKEKVLIPAWITDVSLIGESVDSTIITYDDHAGRGKMGTFDTYTFRIAGNDIFVENLTIENSAGPVGQAVALHIEGDRCVLRNCRLLGNQDTLFASGENSRQYYINCYIEGTTDFIFGPATAIFQDCVIHSKKDSYITAASTPVWVQHGYVFIDCKLTAEPEVDEAYLGRPWRDYARTVWINTEMGDHILPEGWHNWGRPEAEESTFYAEWGSTGPGANPEERVDWSHQLKAKEVKEYTLENIFGNWNPLVESYFVERETR